AEWFGTLLELPMIESFSTHRGWNVHETARLAVRDRLARKDRGEFCELARRAAEYFQGEDHNDRVERIYHRLLAAPETAALELERLWREWDRSGRHEQLQALGLAIGELIGTPL